MCDLVLFKAERILQTALKLQRAYALKVEESTIIASFIQLIKNNFPVFEMARFCEVDKKLLYKIFEVICTFLVINLQFILEKRKNNS